MDNINKIEQLLSDIESKPLSQSIPSVLTIALECKDYKGFCVLSQLIKPLSESQKTNKIQTKEIINVLLLQGISKKDVSEIIKESVEEYIEMKTISKDQVSSHSVKEIEDWIMESKDILESVRDAYGNIHQNLFERIIQMRKLYETMRGYVISKLMYYQQFFKTSEENKSGQGDGEMKKINTEKVFIVHGHNGEIKEAVARLIEKQGIQAIILHEQANKGDTIIEKFERNSDVGCAICLFTADDLGRAEKESEEKHRARQNVVFETGYFIGKIGRDRVVLIADPDVEIPSDLKGVVYVDSDNWRFSVLKELRAIGYNVDYNKLV